MCLTRYIVIGLCVLLTSCVSPPPPYHPNQSVKSQISITQAREIVRKNTTLMRVGTAVKINFKSHKDNSKFEEVVSFRDLVKIGSHSTGEHSSVWVYNKDGDRAILITRTDAEAKNLADALYVLSKAPMNQLCIPEDPSEQAKFEEAARQYRTQSVKPVLPEEAWKYKVQADTTAGQKQYDDAIDLYGNALKVAPWWPEGHFNRALLMSNVQDYCSAVQEMKRYILLAPNAPDARKAQDQVYQWEVQMR